MPVTEETLQDFLDKASQGKGLLPVEALTLIREAPEELWPAIKGLASVLTLSHFQKKLFVFAPLYFSNICVNDCDYCGFRRSNRDLKRLVLSSSEVAREARTLWEAGHRTLLLVGGEHFYQSGALKMASYLLAFAKERLPFSIGIEVGPMDFLQYRALAEMGVSRLVLYQESYDREVYSRVHSRGPKRGFDWRYEAPARAIAAGISQVGIGFLAGLGSWQAEVYALIQHAHYLESVTGKVPATISVPRLRPAFGVKYENPSFGFVSDQDYEKILAVLRLAFPKTGIVVSTRESESFRNSLLERGFCITHLSAGVSTEPGGYWSSKEEQKKAGQFEISDSRSLAEVAGFAGKLGYEICYEWGHA